MRERLHEWVSPVYLDQVAILLLGDPKPRMPITHDKQSSMSRSAPATSSGIRNALSHDLFNWWCRPGLVRFLESGRCDVERRGLSGGLKRSVEPPLDVGPLLGNAMLAGHPKQRQRILVKFRSQRSKEDVFFAVPEDRILRMRNAEVRHIVSNQSLRDEGVGRAEYLVRPIQIVGLASSSAQRRQPPCPCTSARVPPLTSIHAPATQPTPRRSDRTAAQRSRPCAI